MTLYIDMNKRRPKKKGGDTIKLTLSLSVGSRDKLEKIANTYGLTMSAAASRIFDDVSVPLLKSEFGWRMDND